MIDFEAFDRNKKKASTGRIIDGEVSKENAWPWQVTSNGYLTNIVTTCCLQYLT